MEDISGKKYAKLTVIKFIEYRSGCNQYWLCRCECGNEKIIRKQHLEKITSCGCWRNICRITHKMSDTKFYSVWEGIQQRCNNKNSTAYRLYGKIHRKCLWKTFEDFRDDMYESYLRHIKKYGEKNTTIDRINNDGHYSKENCRWATYKEQTRNTNRNKFLTFQGKTMCVADWTKSCNFKKDIIFSRLKLGWSVEKILTTHVK